MTTLIYCNPNDWNWNNEKWQESMDYKYFDHSINSSFWKRNYELNIFGDSYMVNADCESEAIDAVIDWIYDNNPDFILTEDEIRHIVNYNEDLDIYVHGGNYGIYLNITWYDITITELKK